MMRDEQTVRFRAVVRPVAVHLSAMTSDWGRLNVRPYVLRHLGVQS